ncbi:MAG: general secretion pathway protein GspK [Verrucomicrobia subdivision 3 bacterium]|nr:general secretion pathway protein GspK [Limisphaerales bacterium]
MRTPQSSAPAGVALIIVMICITVLSILAAGFAYSMKVETKLAMNANSEAELNSLGRSGVELARWVLAQQATIAQEPFDALNQKWAGGPGSMMTSNSPLAGVALDNIQLGGGKFSVRITDLERKVNINLADQPMLEQALRLIGVDPSESAGITGSILDWIDQDSNQHINGTESDYYANLDPPYQAKNGPVDDLSELLLVRGVTPDIYWGGVATNHLPAAFQNKVGFRQPGGGVLAYDVGLVDLFTPLSSGQININTASAKVLQMLPFVDENVAAEIIRLRSGPDGMDGSDDDTPFRSPGELVNAGLNNQVVGQIARYCTVRSRTFEVQVDAEINGYHRYFYAIVGRNGSRDVPVLAYHWKFAPAIPGHANAR